MKKTKHKIKWWDSGIEKFGGRLGVNEIDFMEEEVFKNAFTGEKHHLAEMKGGQEHFHELKQAWFLFQWFHA